MEDNDLDFQCQVQINLDLVGRFLKAKRYLFENETWDALELNTDSKLTLLIIPPMGTKHQEVVEKPEQKRSKLVQRIPYVVCK